MGGEGEAGEGLEWAGIHRSSNTLDTVTAGEGYAWIQ